MCGIFGFNWEDKKLLSAGLQKTSHRGPDDRDMFVKKGISLGHNRLAIVDLSKAGRQPMTNEDHSVYITFNGEIYNHKELKGRLKQKHRFMSNSDTEVILHLYEEKGYDVVNELQGMFAFCIYDARKQVLFLARDRLGVKPLYYYNQGGKLLFASEIKAILEGPVKRAVNAAALPSYLAFRANTEEDTFFQGVKKLLPGHTLVYHLKTHKCVIKQYWDVDFTPVHDSVDSYKKQVRTLLDDAVRCRLMSDVPFGAFLSGGVDSGSVVALMSKHCSKPVKTFSVGFAEDRYSELLEARELSKQLKTDHHELQINESSIAALPSIVYHADEPLADPTMIPTYFLSRYAKKYCTVILTGEGADEIFGGYPQYNFMKIHASLMRKIPRSLRNMLGSSVAAIPTALLNKYFPYASDLGEKGRERFKRYLVSNDYTEQYLEQVTIFNEDEQSSLLVQPMPLSPRYKAYFKKATPATIIGACERFDLKEPMVDDLLMKVDKATMAFSIEARTPFLDYRLVELAARIPDNYKLQSSSKTKLILRQAVSSFLPSATAQRKKRHFFVPIHGWLEKNLKPIRETLLSESHIRKQGIFNWEYIDHINQNWEKSKLFYARQLWSLIVFQIWHQMYIEGKKVVL